LEEEPLEDFVVPLNLHSDWGLNDFDVLNDEILHLTDQLLNSGGSLDNCGDQRNVNDYWCRNWSLDWKDGG
jgi:hypothetical protein